MKNVNHKAFPESTWANQSRHNDGEPLYLSLLSFNAAATCCNFGGRQRAEWISIFFKVASASIRYKMFKMLDPPDPIARR